MLDRARVERAARRVRFEKVVEDRRKDIVEVVSIREYDDRLGRGTEKATFRNLVDLTEERIRYHGSSSH